MYTPPNCTLRKHVCKCDAKQETGRERNLSGARAEQHTESMLIHVVINNVSVASETHVVYYIKSFTSSSYYPTCPVLVKVNQHSPGENDFFKEKSTIAHSPFKFSIIINLYTVSALPTF